MPLFGAHMSIAGGLHNALHDAIDHQCETVQLFSKNASQWNAPDLTQEQIQQFRQLLRKSKLRYPTVHDSYLINLASPKTDLYRRSIEAFIDELQRAEQLGISYLVTHPGASIDGNEDAALKRIAKAIDEAHDACRGFKVQILLETTAGQGTTLGHRFEHLAQICSLVQSPERLGICLDTCHVFAAGYPLAPEKSYRETMKLFDRLIGLKWLKLFHINDSKKPFGSRVDRHEQRGEEHLRTEPYRLIVDDYRFRGKPIILETPKGTKDEDLDTVNLTFLRNLLERRSVSQAG